MSQKFYKHEIMIPEITTDLFQANPRVLAAEVVNVEIVGSGDMKDIVWTFLALDGALYPLPINKTSLRQTKAQRLMLLEELKAARVFQDGNDGSEDDVTLAESLLGACVLLEIWWCGFYPIVMIRGRDPRITVELPWATTTASLDE